MASTMAAVVPTAEKAANSLQKLSLDALPKTQDVAEAAKKPNANQLGHAGNGVGTNAPVAPFDRSITPILQEFMDPNMCYASNGYPSPTYYYGHGSANDWDDYSRYGTADGVDMSHHGVYGNLYHGYGYGCAHYGAYSPASAVPTIGHDGQFYGPQHYQYPGQYYQSPTPTGSAHTTELPPSSQGGNPSVTTDQQSMSVDLTKAKSNGNTNSSSDGNSGTVKLKSDQKNSSLTPNVGHAKSISSAGFPSHGYQDPRFGYNGMRSPTPWITGSAFSDAQHLMASNPYIPNNAQSNNALHPTRPATGVGQSGPGFTNRIYPSNRLYGQHGNAFRNGHCFGLNAYDSRTNGRGWIATDGKFRVRGRGNGFNGYGSEKTEDLNELNRGPRSSRSNNNPRDLGPNIVLAVKGQALPLNPRKDNSEVVSAGENYNREDFSVSYENAKFFIIKSYSEDDVHKSVKYNVWASTPNGNKKLDAAFQEAKEQSGGCRMFLFFSVNTSGQFVGVAEMVGPVDFNKTVDYWQQDKWNGCFPVKWHIVKDVPNNILKHITLENNDNKPVTNSRDTQEVFLNQGLQMLKIFKEHVSKTCILDDFSFYEARQKTMQEKRAKQQFQKQVWEGKAMGVVDGKDITTIKPGSLKVEPNKALNMETSQGGLGDDKLSEKCMTTGSGEGPKLVKPVTEKWTVANGVSSGVLKGIVDQNGVAKGNGNEH